MNEYLKELKNIMLELPKVLLHIITVITFALFYGFYSEKWKNILREVNKALYE